MLLGQGAVLESLANPSFWGLRSLRWETENEVRDEENPLDAWSMPIKSVAGTILRTFGTYFRDHRTPTPEEKTGVENLAAAAALVLARASPHFPLLAF